MEFEIIIQPDGTMLIPRGSKEQNDVVRQILDGLGVSAEEFLSVTDESDILFGQSTLCG